MISEGYVTWPSEYITKLWSFYQKDTHLLHRDHWFLSVTPQINCFFKYQYCLSRVNKCPCYFAEMHKYHASWCRTYQGNTQQIYPTACSIPIYRNVTRLIHSLNRNTTLPMYMHGSCVLLWKCMFTKAWVWTYLCSNNLLSSRFCNKNNAVQSQKDNYPKPGPTLTDAGDLTSLSTLLRLQTLVCTSEKDHIYWNYSIYSLINRTEFSWKLIFRRTVLHGPNTVM